MQLKTLFFIFLISSTAFEGTAGFFFGPINFSFGPFNPFSLGSTGTTTTATTTGTTVTGCVAVVPLILKLMGYRPTCSGSSGTATTTTTASTTCAPECLKFICDTAPYCNPPYASATTFTMKCSDGAAPPVASNPTISLPCNNVHNPACTSGAPGCPSDCPAPSPPAVFPPTSSLC